MKKATLSLLTLLILSCSSTTYQHITQADINDAQSSLPFDMPAIKIPEIPITPYIVLNYGADNSGETLSTSAFQNAIDEASNHGGGTVIVPEGIYVIGPIVMKSNVRLYTESNSLIIFSKDINLYPIIDASFEGLETKRCQSPISAYEAENIAICGHGTFNGSGDYWRPLKRSKVSQSQWDIHIKTHPGVVSEDGETWYPTTGALEATKYCLDQNVPTIENDSDWEYIRAFLRPVLLNFVKCKNVLLDGVTFENSPAWNLHPLMCENVIVSHLAIRNPSFSQNGDGIDIESCKNVLIQKCSFDVGDDAICMKSGKNENGRRRGMPTENVIIRNNEVYHGHGGFVVGSEMSGGIRNILVTQCTFIGTDIGLRFKSTRGRGGVVENIYINNINMFHILRDALLFDLFYEGKASLDTDDNLLNGKSETPDVTEETPQFKNIYISDCLCKEANRAMYFNGLPEMPILNVNLKNIHFTSTFPAEFHQVEGLEMDNVVVNGENICAE